MRHLFPLVNIETTFGSETSTMNNAPSAANTQRSLLENKMSHAPATLKCPLKSFMPCLGPSPPLYLLSTIDKHNLVNKNLGWRTAWLFNSSWISTSQKRMIPLEVERMWLNKIAPYLPFSWIGRDIRIEICYHTHRYQALAKCPLVSTYVASFNEVDPVTDMIGPLCGPGGCSNLCCKSREYRYQHLGHVVCITKRMFE